VGERAAIVLEVVLFGGAGKISAELVVGKVSLNANNCGREGESESGSQRLMGPGPLYPSILGLNSSEESDLYSQPLVSMVDVRARVRR